MVAVLVAALATIACCMAYRAARGLATPGGTIGSIAWAALACAWFAACSAGFVSCAEGLLPAAVLVACAAGGGVAPFMRDALSKSGAAAEAARVVAVASAPFLALFLLEWPYNDALFSMAGDIARLNLTILAAACAAAWFCGQRRGGPLVALLAACLAIGVANYFVCEFKGQTILPADALAVGTAAAVASGYEYVLRDAPVQAVAALAAYAALVLAIPGGRPATPASRRMGAACNLVVGLLAVNMLVGWYQTNDIADRYGVKVDVWATRDSYMRYGTVPCFLQRLQEVRPDAPDGYATDLAAGLQESLADEWDRAHPGYEPVPAGERPSIVVVMNESFSDLGIYPGVEGYGGIGRFWAVGGVEDGWAYTSVRGGGTCNSEFEYLAGSTLASVGGGVYPYMFYDLDGIESLPRYLGALGYSTHAIHPAESQNWRRDVVYRQLGFDEFASGERFEGADRLRGLVTDAETYGVVIDMLRDGSAPQFVFDVTIQNHGGYTTGLVDAGAYAGVSVNGVEVEGMAEFLTCMDASIEDTLAFLDELAGLDRPVLVVFFGDHQPGFNDEIAEAAWGCPVSDLDLARVQQRFVTPYLVWANYDLGEVAAVGAGASDAAGEGGAAAPGPTCGTSLAYLAARTAYLAGLPLTQYQKALLTIAEDMPAVNLNGYADAGWNWYWIKQDGPAREAYRDFEQLQFANLFDDAGNAAFDAFVSDAAGGDGR